MQKNPYKLITPGKWLINDYMDEFTQRERNEVDTVVLYIHTTGFI